MPYTPDSKGRQHHVSLFGSKKDSKPASGYGTPVTPAASRGVSLADSRQGSCTHTKPYPASRSGSQQPVSVRPSTSHSQHPSPSGRSRAGTIVPSQCTARMGPIREDYLSQQGSYHPSARQSMREADASALARTNSYGHSARPSRSMTATNPNSACYHQSSAYATTAYHSSMYGSASSYQSSFYESGYGGRSNGDNQLDYYRAKALDAARNPEAVSIWKGRNQGRDKVRGDDFSCKKMSWGDEPRKVSGCTYALGRLNIIGQ